MRDSFAVSWCPAESTLCGEVEETDWQTCTPQQYVPLRLWDALRSVSDQSPNIYHPLFFSKGECRKPCRCVMPGGEGNTRCGCPPSLSAQQSLIPRIICSLFSFTDFFFSQSVDVFWRHQIGSHLPFRKGIPHISTVFHIALCRLWWLQLRREGCSHASRTTPQNSLFFSLNKSYPAQYLSAINLFYDGLKPSLTSRMIFSPFHLLDWNLH